MSAQIDDDDAAAFAHQAQLEHRQRNACEKCGEPAVAMLCDRLLCNECYDDMTVWEPREGYEEFIEALDEPEYVEESDDE